MYAEKKQQHFFIFSYQSLSFFIHVKQNLPNDYIEENQPLFNQSYRDIYPSIMIYIQSSIRESGADKLRQRLIDIDLDRYRQTETDSFGKRQTEI